MISPSRLGKSWSYTFYEVTIQLLDNILDEQLSVTLQISEVGTFTHIIEGIGAGIGLAKSTEE
jgi:hypothetical protein